MGGCSSGSSRRVSCVASAAPPKRLLVCFLSQLDRTEVIKSNLHPVFAKVFSLDYYFEEVQKLRFEVYDIHGTHSIGTRDDDFLGGVECTLGQVERCLPPGLAATLSACASNLFLRLRR